MPGNGPSIGLERFADQQRWLPFRAHAAGIAIVFWATFLAASPATGQAVPANSAATNTCATCHSNAVKDLSGNPHASMEHTDVNRALLCENCHGPGQAHADSADPAKIKGLKSAAQQDAVCTRCHREKAGPFVYEHDVVKTEGCTACHFAHGGPNPRLLNRAKVNTICTQCHSPSPAAHNPANQNQPCTECHTEIHGSNTHPNFFKTSSENTSGRVGTSQSFTQVLTIGADVRSGAVRPLAAWNLGTICSLEASKTTWRLEKRFYQ